MSPREPSRFLRWYFSSMGSFLPQWVKAICLGHPMARTCRFVDGEWDSRSRTLPLGLLTGDAPPSTARFRQTIDAVVPENLFLTRVVTLPRKAAARMHQIGTLDLMQKTPFQASEVTWAIGPVLREKEQVHMTQVIALNSELTAWFDRMEAANQPLRRIYMSLGRKNVLVADYGNKGGKYQRFWPVINATGAAVTLSCALYLWAVPGLKATEQVAALKPETARLQIQALALREQVEQSKADQERRHDLLASISGAPRLLDALIAATAALPDPVWVSQYVFDPTGVRMFAEVDGSAVDLLYTLADRALLPNTLMQGDVQTTATGTEEFWLLHDHLARQ